MRPRSLAVAAIVIAVATVCVRLGFWQLDRLEQKRRLNAELRQALTLPATIVADPRNVPDSLLHRRVELHGVYDEHRQVLLAGRSHDGAPGVHVVTPLVIAGDSLAVLVDRGWLPAPDAATARPQDFAEPGPRVVTGIADTLARGAIRYRLRMIESDSVTLYSTLRLDPDSLSQRVPYSLARIVVRQLPGSGPPALPALEAPKPFDEMMHLSYAIQWFSFAAILVGGTTLLSWRRRRGASQDTVPREPVPDPGNRPA